VEPATLEGPITVGELSPPADPRPVDLEAIGYTQEEYFASGIATSFAIDGAATEDGRWNAQPATTAPYTTRFLVRRPSDPSRFNGTVVVEWMNVTAVESAPEWAYTGRAIVDAGAAWIGVSAQALGVVGGTPLIDTGSDEQAALAEGLKTTNPERYGSLEHPGDAYAFDIFSQIGAAVRAPDGAIGGLGEVRSVIAAGQSQSAAYLTGYINAIQPVANVFDGFFVHSRGSSGAVPGAALTMRDRATVHRFRDDLDAEIMTIETETDIGLLGYGVARQPDTERLRVWEVAGTSHADAYLVGDAFDFCPTGINTGPQHYVTNAGIEALIRWIDGGTAPPSGEPLATDAADPTVILRDERGIARGGVRTPPVDVPVAALTGESSADASVLCRLFGATLPFDEATLRSLYPTRQDYLAKFEQSLDDAIAAGFVRPADRAEFLAEASASASTS
jgi:hypothetical protein